MSDYFISMTVDNSLRVLQRVCSILSRSRINIDRLNVFESKNSGLSHIDIVVNVNKQSAFKVESQLGKITELHEILVRPSVAPDRPDSLNHNLKKR